MQNIDISIIIVNWNAKELLRNCLNSVYENTKGNYEIYVVDNNSSDDSCEMLKNEFLSKENFHLIENKDNKGFASANNQAIKMCNSKAVLLLNPDTLVSSNVIFDVYNCLFNDKKIGVAGCKVLNTDGTLQLACRRMAPRPLDAFYKLFGISKLMKDNEKFTKYNLTYVSEEEFCDVDSVSGAFLMMKKEVIDKIGYLDETFFMYGEEMDWCMRAKKEGYLVRYCPVGSIIHYKGESSKQLGVKATYEFYRAMIIFYNKYNKPEHNFIVNFVVYVGIVLLGGINILKNTIVKEKRVGSKG